MLFNIYFNIHVYVERLAQFEVHMISRFYVIEIFVTYITKMTNLGGGDVNKAIVQKRYR